MTTVSANRMSTHARWETRLLLRNGEQLLLTFAIPIGLLLGLALVYYAAQILLYGVELSKVMQGRAVLRLDPNDE